MSKIFTLYYSPGACSFVPHAVLRTLDLPHRLVAVSLSDGQQREPDYLAINAKGRVPTLTGGSLPPGQALTEAPAICRYLTALKPEAGLWPNVPLAEARLMEWLNYLSGHFHAFAWAMFARPERFSPEKGHHETLGQQARVQLEMICTYIEKQLGDGRDFAVPATAPEAPSALTPADFYLLIQYRWLNLRLGWPMHAKAPYWTALVARLLTLPEVQATLAAENLDFWASA